MQKSAIKDLSGHALKQWLEEHGQPKFRSDQLCRWLYDKRAVEFDEMRNIPKDLRRQLDEDFLACSLTVADTLEAADGTVKYLYRLADGETIESVVIEAPGRHTVCISTQVGCAVRCSFCASGHGGLVRDLTAAEIVDQVVMACRQLGERVDNIVIMGMGEPLLNYENLERALDLINAPEGLGIGARRITVSTSGIPEGIRRLADSGRQWNLALSLHATRDIQRARLIPSSYRFALADILDACRYYHEKSNRMVTLEYTMLHGRNCSAEDAERLAAIASEIHAKVNLIPYNPTVSGHAAPTRTEEEAFIATLARHGVTATIRREKGADIQAACGQLRHERG